MLLYCQTLCMFLYCQALCMFLYCQALCIFLYCQALYIFLYCQGVYSSVLYVYLSGYVESVPLPEVLPRAVFTPPPSLFSTVYLSDRGLDTQLSGQVGQGTDVEGHDMLSVAVKIDLDSQQNNKVSESSVQYQ